MRVLVAGASGGLGRRVCAQLVARGHAVRALGRRRARLPAAPGIEPVALALADGAALATACREVDVVFSALGASVALRLGAGYRRYGRVDVPANRALIAAARAAGAPHVVYVACSHTPAMARLDYVAAHEAVVRELRASGLGATVIRPTGFFSALGTLVDLARWSKAPVLGRGGGRSNPIDDDELAVLCADAVEQRPDEIAAGGPDVLTRREMAELAAAAVGHPGAVRHVPIGLARAASWLVRPLSPRLYHLVDFVAALDRADVVAPARGQRHLADYFAARAAAAAA